VLPHFEKGYCTTDSNHLQIRHLQICLNDDGLNLVFVQYLELRYHRSVRLLESFIAIVKMVRDKHVFF